MAKPKIFVAILMRGAMSQRIIDFRMAGETYGTPGCFPFLLRERLGMNKIPAITFSFWVMKICATTLGETAGDLVSMTLKVGYAVSSVILLGIFLATLLAQLGVKKFHPVLYWSVILSTSTAGTTMSDFMDRTLGLGYATGSLILSTLLVGTLVAWKMTEKSLSVSKIETFRGELFYWTAILFSNTLGTAMGDYLADHLGLGFVRVAVILGAFLGVLWLAYVFTNLSHVFLFWAAFVLTRPFGATFGDVLTKSQEQGGLNLGTIGSSLVLLGILMFLLFVTTWREGRKAGPRTTG